MTVDLNKEIIHGFFSAKKNHISTITLIRQMQNHFKGYEAMLIVILDTTLKTNCNEVDSQLM